MGVSNEKVIIIIWIMQYCKIKISENDTQKLEEFINQTGILVIEKK
jgi:hypothetical protein